MNARQAERWKALLLRERDASLEALHRLEDEEAEPQSVSAGDTVRGQKGMAETASDTSEQEADFASATHLSAQIADLDAALDTLRESPERFGVCEDCGARVEKRRLRIVPWTRTCVACAERREGALV
jgi:RNA polymerase-binding transcription factor DksA